MKEIDAQKEIFVDQLQLSNIHKQQSTAIDQNLINRYNNFYSQRIQTYSDCIYEELNCSEYFNQFDISYDPAKEDQNQFILDILEHSINYQVVVFSAQWGKFMMKIKILNVEDSSPVHKNELIKGSYGRIYSLKNHEKQDFVIKCIPFQSWKCQKQAKMMAIKQYFLLKIASAIRVGPFITNILGFDLCLYEHCIEFAIETCDNVCKLQKKEKQQIWSSLHLLHKFHIIHSDIKPPNIMMSRKYQKIVFIDFGLAIMRKITIGQKSQTMFRGTIQYSSPQMLLIFEDTESKPVDIYHNDAYALQISIKQLQHQANHQIQFIEIPECSHNFQSFHIPNNSFILLYRLKWLLFEQKIHKTASQLHKYQKNKPNYIFNVLTFLHQLNPSHQIRQFYLSLSNLYQLQGIEYSQLNKIYQQKFNVLRSIMPNPEKREKFQNYFNNLCDNKNQFDEDLWNEAKIQNFLSDEHEVINLELYCSIYLNYISFTNNTFRLTMPKRVSISKIVQNKVLSQSNSSLKQDMSDLLYIKSIIIHMFELIIENIKNDKIKNHRMTIKLLFNLIEHLFVLNIGTKRQLLERLEEVYTCQLLSVEDKIELMLKVKHNSYWLLYRFKNNSKNERILDWCYEKVLQLKKDSTLLNPILAEIVDHWQIDQQITLSMESTFLLSKICSKSLKQQLNMQILSKSLMKVNLNDFNNAISNIYTEIPPFQRNKIFFFLFDALYIYHECLFHIDQCHEIIVNIKNNIQCDQILDELLIISSVDISIADSPKIYLQKLSVFLNNLDKDTIFIHTYAVRQAFSKLDLIMYKKQYANVAVLSKISQKFQTMITWLNLQNIFTQKRINTSKRHFCINFQSFYNIIMIKKFINKFTNRLQNVKQDLKTISYKFSLTKCRHCYHYYQNLCENMYQKQLINQIHKKQNKIDSQSEKQFIQSYQRLATLNHQFQKSDDLQYLMDIQRHSLFEFCRVSYKLQNRYHGNRQLYQHLIKIGQVWDYLKFNEMNNTLLGVTIEVVFQHISQHELAKFLSSLTNFMTKMDFSSSFQTLFNAFDNFTFRFQRRIQFSSFYAQLVQLQLISSNKDINTYNCIYYLILLFYLPQNIKSLLKKKLANLLKFLPAYIKKYIQVHYYRFLLIQNSEKTSDMMEKRKEEKIKI